MLQALDEVEGLARLRISSIEPNLLTDEIIAFVANKSKCVVPHFHNPLQSGSDQLLKSMRRKYDTNLYRSRVEKIKALMPQACIGVDVIIGYPGETDELFLETYNFLNQLDISYLHVFTYSERVNTTAQKLPGKVPMKTRNERSKMLHILSDKKRRFFYEQQLHKKFPVLWEAENDQDIMYGFTSNYVKVQTNYDPSLVNEIMEVQLEQITDNMLVKVKQLSLV